jgi:hypothetical protein
VTDDATNGGRRAYDARRSGSGAERGVMPQLCAAIPIVWFSRPETEHTRSGLVTQSEHQHPHGSAAVLELVI